MKKAIIAIALLVPSLALAAPAGYKDAADCKVPPDHGIWNLDNTKITGCISADAWNAAQAPTRVVGEDAKYVAALFAAGTERVGKNGVRYSCPAFFFRFMCVLPEEAR